VDDFDGFARDLQETIIQQARDYYSAKVVEFWLNPQNMGCLEHPQAYAKITGPCGDTMEVFLKIDGDQITKATFRTDGCGPSLACGTAVTELAIGKTLEEAGAITQDMILNELGGLPDESKHCALLASTTLAKAIREFVPGEVREPSTAHPCDDSVSAPSNPAKTESGFEPE
jgi:nitrogen fixation NifU-like protein